MVGMLFSDVFNSKIVYDEAELDGAGDVVPQARSVSYLIITVWRKAFAEKFTIATSLTNKN